MDELSNLAEFSELDVATYQHSAAIAWQRIQQTAEQKANKIAWQDENLIEELYKSSIHQVEQTKALAWGKIRKKDKRLRE